MKQKTNKFSSFNWNKSNLRQFLKFISVTKFNFSFLITYANHLVIFIQLVWKLLCWPCPSALLGEHSSHRTYLAIWRSWRLSRLSWHHGVLPWPVFVYFKGQFRYWVGAGCLIGFGQPIGILLSLSFSRQVLRRWSVGLFEQQYPQFTPFSIP